MNLATLCHDENTNTWSAEFDGQVLVRSVGGESSKQYVISRILEGKCSKALKLNVTGFSNLGPVNFAPSPTSEGVSRAYTPQAPRVKPNNLLSVEERYELLDECVDIVIRNIGIRSLIITGEGSLGKTFHTKEKIREHGLLSTEEAMKLAYTLTPEEQVVADNILRRMKECRAQAIAYYKEHGLPKTSKADRDEDEDEEDEELDELELVFGDVDFTGLHTSKSLEDRTCGGRFFPGTNKYQFNIKLAMANPSEYYDIIVPHEVAHHVQFMLFPKSLKVKQGHGKEWCKIMTSVFGIPADRYHTMDVENVKQAPDLAGDYHYVKGYSSAKGLFRTLFENKKKLVVFDDCDAAWKNEVSANLLKAALDTDTERWVTWNVEGSANDDLPRSFLFEGRVIFISNVKSEDFPQPLITRSLRADLEMTIEERFERMRQILPSEKFAPGVSMEIKEEAYKFLYDNREIAAEISSRSLLNVIQVANSGSKLWKRIALANIT
jgi:hypothetical protein